jgi:hypothetical protein
MAFSFPHLVDSLGPKNAELEGEASHDILPVPRSVSGRRVIKASALPVTVCAADRVFPLLLGSLPRLMAFLDLCVYPAWSSRRQPISNRAASSHA